MIRDVFVPIICMIVLFAATCIGIVYFITLFSCSNYADMYNLNYKIVGIENCYVFSDGNWILRRYHEWKMH